MTESVGKMMVVIGLLIAVLGGLVWLSSFFPGPGRLPGDILIRKGNLTVYIPLATSILASILLSLFFWFLSRR